MSVIIVEMPSLSPTMEQGNIVKWLVKEGDFIESGAVIAEIATDKSTVEYESLDEGYLKKILVVEGNEVAVGSVVAVMTEEEGDDWKGEVEKILQKQQETAIKESSTEMEEGEVKEQKLAVSNSVQQVVSSFVEAVVPPKDIPAPMGSIQSIGDVKVSPVAKKLAEERNINLTAVKASNEERISKADVENLPNGYGQNLAESNKGLIGYVSRAGKPFVDVPMNQMRKAISSRMVQASAGVPVFFLTLSIEMDKLIALRQELNTTQSLRISVNDFIVKASALALRDYPEVNSAFQGDFIRQFNDVDVSVAVSTPNGLITPIVRSADTKGLLAINQEVKSLAKKAFANSLELDEYQGGSFTISNLGMFGVDEFTAILNPPQVAILAIGGVKKQLAFNDDKDIIEKNVMNVTLTSDHRVIDGVLAAKFLGKFKEYLENPIQLVL